MLDSLQLVFGILSDNGHLSREDGRAIRATAKSFEGFEAASPLEHIQDCVAKGRPEGVAVYARLDPRISSRMVRHLEERARAPKHVAPQIRKRREIPRDSLMVLREKFSSMISRK